MYETISHLSSSGNSCICNFFMQARKIIKGSTLTSLRNLLLIYPLLLPLSLRSPESEAATIHVAYSCSTDGQEISLKLPMSVDIMTSGEHYPHAPLASLNLVLKVHIDPSGEYRLKVDVDKSKIIHANIADVENSFESPLMKRVIDLILELDHLAKADDGIILSDEDIRKKIAEIHYLFAHLTPFIRGSGAISEQLADALYLCHGLIPPEKKEGVNRDLEALLCPFKDHFVKSYSAGIRLPT